MPVSAFRKQKFADEFASWDSNGDGVLEATDFSLGADRMADRMGVPVGSAAAKRVRDAYAAMWTKFFAPADRDHDGRITLSELQQAQEYLSDLPREQFEASSREVIGASFDALDLNADGKISRPEYDAFLAVHGNAASAPEVWPRLDTDGDGHLSRDEFMRLSFEYFATDDPSAPGNLLFGRR